MKFQIEMYRRLYAKVQIGYEVFCTAKFCYIVEQLVQTVLHPNIHNVGNFIRSL